MKKLLTLLFLIITSLTCIAGNEPKKLTMQVNYVTSSDTLFLNNIRNSSEACCRFNIVTVKSNENKILICNNKILLGTLYGQPTDKFLLTVYDRCLGFID